MSCSQFILYQILRSLFVFISSGVSSCYFIFIDSGYKSAAFNSKEGGTNVVSKFILVFPENSIELVKFDLISDVQSNFLKGM